MFSFTLLFAYWSLICCERCCAMTDCLIIFFVTTNVKLFFVAIELPFSKKVSHNEKERHILWKRLGEAAACNVSRDHSNHQFSNNERGTATQRIWDPNGRVPVFAYSESMFRPSCFYGSTWDSFFCQVVLNVIHLVAFQWLCHQSLSLCILLGVVYTKRMK